VGALVVFALAGVLAGAAHFGLLRRNVDLWLGGGGAIAAAVLPLGRLALTSAVLAFSALHGRQALLGCAAGMICARAAVLGRATARAT
jgi:hypothetical protein